LASPDALVTVPRVRINRQSKINYR